MIFKYEEMTHQDLASLPSDKTVIFLPCSPLEEHGVHLPLGVDPMIASHISALLAQRLQGKLPEWNFVLFPVLYAGSDVLRYRGSIETSQNVIRQLLLSCASQFAKDGFQRIIAVGGHGGPRHVVALEEVASWISWRYRRTKMISATGRVLFDILKGSLYEDLKNQLIKSGHPLSEEAYAALKTDYHAGMIETSLMLVFRPDLVRPHFDKQKPAIIDRFWKITPNSARRVGDGLGHLGSPHHASKAIGDAFIEILFERMLPEIEGFLTTGNYKKRSFRSPLYWIPIFRSHFSTLALMIGSLAFAFLMMAYLMSFMISAP